MDADQNQGRGGAITEDGKHKERGAGTQSSTCPWSPTGISEDCSKTPRGISQMSSSSGPEELAQ